MNFISKIDAAVTAFPHQWLVDRSRRTGEWWMKQAGIALVVFGCLRFVFREDSPTWRAIGFAIDLWVAWDFALRGPVQVRIAAMDAGRWLRMLFAFFGILFLATLMFAGKSVTLAAILGGAVLVLIVAGQFFAACKPPAPPKRREQPNLGLAT